MEIKKIKQHDITDCGAACLASIAEHFKLKIPLARVRQYASTDKKGTNLFGLIEAATKLGFMAKGVKGPIESLSKIPLPASSCYNQKRKRSTISFCGYLSGYR